MLADWRTAPIDERLRTVLALLVKLHDDPDAVGPADIARVRAAGVSDAAIEDAVAASAAFHAIVRVADALGFRLREGEAARSAAHLLARGYA